MWHELYVSDVHVMCSSTCRGFCALYNVTFVLVSVKSVWWHHEEHGQIAPLLKNWEQLLCVNVGVHNHFVTTPLSHVTALSSTVRATISVKFGQWHDSTVPLLLR